MKALVILNPIAGKKSSGVVSESLRRHFSGVIDYEVYETKKEDKAVTLIASAPHSRKIDIMSRSGQTCVINASVGLSASIVRGTSRESKNHFGRLDGACI